VGSAVERRAPTPSRTAREALVALAACLSVGVASVTLSLAVPLRAMGGDTVPGRLGAAVFACKASFDLREVDWLAAAVDMGRRPYFVLPARSGEVVSMYGPAPAVLGAPFLEGLEPGSIVTDRDLARAARVGAAMAVGVAAMLLAAALCARTTTLRAALLALAVVGSVAGAGALGEALSQQTALVVPLTVALATLAWSEWRRGALLLATPAALVVAFFVRPASSFVLLALGAAWCLAWREHGRGRGWLAAALALAIVVALPQAAWCLSAWGHVLPTGQITSTAAATSDGVVFVLRPGAVAGALAGLVASPARGLLWFAPLLLVALVMAARRGDGGARLIALGCVGQMLLIASWRMWWGGWTYGPRLLDEAIWMAPWLVVSSPGTRDLSSRVALAASGAVTVVVGLLGAARYDGAWDLRRDPDRHAEALWDVRDAPIAALARGESITATDAPPGPYAYCVDRALVLVRPR
jgi:hypothetical protein